MHVYPSLSRFTPNILSSFSVSPYESMKERFRAQYNMEEDTEEYREFIKRVDLIEQRVLEPVLSRTAILFRNLEKDWLEADDMAPKQGNYPYCIGIIEEYPGEQWKDFSKKILIHNGYILFLAPSDLHENIS